MKYYIYTYHKGNLLEIREVTKEEALHHVTSREDKKSHKGGPLRYNR